MLKLVTSFSASCPSFFACCYIPLLLYQKEYYQPLEVQPECLQNGYGGNEEYRCQDSPDDQSRPRRLENQTCTRCEQQKLQLF